MPERKRKTGLIIGAIVGVVAIAAIAIVLVFTLGNAAKTSKLLGRWNITGMSFAEQTLTMEDIKEFGFENSYIEFKEDNKLSLSLYNEPSYEIKYDEEKGIIIDNSDKETAYTLDGDDTITIELDNSKLTFKKAQ